jgi:acyl CoA:acetate/3-ketoacid CoA transferase
MDVHNPLAIRGRPGQPKVLSAAEAVDLVPSGATLVVTGSGGGVNEPTELLAALERRFCATGEPARLVLYHPNGIGDSNGGGSEAFAHAGFVRSVYGSHWSWAPRLSQLAVENAFEVGVWPQGVLSQLLREAAARRPGLLTKIGLGTYLDKRVQTGRLDRQQLPELVEFAGEEWLFYPAPKVDVAFIRATEADEDGNLTMDEEGAVLDVLSAAQAAHVGGGLVIAQVKRRVPARALDPLRVRVPGYLVDVVVLAPHQRQSAATNYNPSYSGAAFVDVPKREIDQCDRLLIARRAALELRPGTVVNLGFGIADGVASVAQSEGVVDQLTFSVEQGSAGGVPAWGSDFGLMWNPTSLIDAPALFDFYDGGGIDLAVVSFAQVDTAGNVNVSHFGGRLVGPGGFMNITQSAKAVVFCGTFTTKGQRVAVHDRRLVIEQEGAVPKFVPQVEQVTWSAAEALRRGQRVLYVTERAVFALGQYGLELVEVAPGLRAADVLSAMHFEPRVASPLMTIPSVVYSEASLGLAAVFAESPQP